MTSRPLNFLFTTLLLASLVGCSSIGLSGDRAAPAIVAGKTQAWYGRVNCWAEDMKVLESDVAACAKYGAKGYMIELLSWGRYSASLDKQAKTEKAYKKLVKLCRDNGLWLFVSIANDNAGQGKYGDTGPKLAGQKALLDWGLNLVMSCGPKNVIVQPVAETQTPYGKSWNTAAGMALKKAGFKTVNNSDGGHPRTKPSWADWNCQHPCDRNAVIRGDLCVSDCGTIIRQLMGGYDTKGNPEYVKNWAARQKGNALVVGFYAFKYPGPTDKATIKAMGDGVK